MTSKKDMLCDSGVLWGVKPSILTANTYYWHGFYGNSSSRHRQSLKYVEEVENWFDEVSYCLKKYGGEKDLEIEVDEDSPCVYLRKDGEEIAHFCISSSARNVYKNQNIRKLKSLINKKIGTQYKPIKKLGDIEKIKPKSSQDVLEIPAKNLPFPDKHDQTNSVWLFQKGKKRYMVFKAGDIAYIIPKSKDKILKAFGEDVCNLEMIEMLSKTFSKNTMREILHQCMLWKLEKI